MNDASRKQEVARTRLPRLSSPPAPRPRRGPGRRAQRPGRQPRRRRAVGHVGVTGPRRPQKIETRYYPSPQGSRALPRRAGAAVPTGGRKGPLRIKKIAERRTIWGGGRRRRKRGADDRSHSAVTRRTEALDDEPRRPAWTRRRRAAGRGAPAVDQEQRRGGALTASLSRPHPLSPSRYVARERLATCAPAYEAPPRFARSPSPSTDYDRVGGASNTLPRAATSYIVCAAH